MIINIFFKLRLFTYFVFGRQEEAGMVSVHCSDPRAKNAVCFILDARYMLAE